MIGPARGHDGAAHRLRQPVSLAGRRRTVGSGGYGTISVETMVHRCQRPAAASLLNPWLSGARLATGQAPGTTCDGYRRLMTEPGAGW